MKKTIERTWAFKDDELCEFLKDVFPDYEVVVTREKDTITVLFKNDDV